MSRLILKGTNGTQFTLNVVQFRSPMAAQITSAQTKTMLQHFPIRAGQPDIEFTVQFASYDDKHIFQNWVRRHQVAGQSDPNGEVLLWWPERNIENWSGWITTFQVAERRFEYAPRVTFGVSLVESLMSAKTIISSVAAPFSAVYGPQISPVDPVNQMLASPIDNLLRPPQQPAPQNVPVPNVTPVSPAPPPSVPGR
jgi:hypothetical protein